MLIFRFGKFLHSFLWLHMNYHQRDLAMVQYSWVYFTYENVEILLLEIINLIEI